MIDTFQEMTYTKIHEDTALRVQYHGDLRGGYTSGAGCSRFYFTFNSVECGNPGTIEHLHYIDRQRLHSRTTTGIGYFFTFGQQSQPMAIYLPLQKYIQLVMRAMFDWMIP